MNKFTFAVTGENIEDRVLGSNLPVLVEFGASWCPPCKMIAPLIENIARKYEGKLLVGVVDDDSDPDIAPRYDVQGLPTLILFQNGQPVQRLVGFRPQQQIESALMPFISIVLEGKA
jgi:thioredoxin 1